MKATHVFVGALCGVSIYAVAVSAYAYRTRDSALRGWSAWQTEIDKNKTSQNDRQMLHYYGEAFRWLLTEKAGINDDDSDMVIAEKLTRHIYDETPFEFPYIDTSNDPLRYFLTVEKKTFNYCSTLSMTLKWALALFDVKSRIVNVAAPDFFQNSKGATHTFIEASIDGRPVVFDPTFSTTYSCGKTSKPVDARTMFECVKAGEPLRPKYLSAPRPGRSLAEYYIALEDLFYAIDATDGAYDGSAFYKAESPSPNWLFNLQTKYAEAAKKAED